MTNYIYNGTYFRTNKDSNPSLLKHSDMASTYHPVFFHVKAHDWENYGDTLVEIITWCKDNIQGKVAYPSVAGMDEYWRRKSPFCVYFESLNEALIAKLKIHT